MKFFLLKYGHLSGCVFCSKAKKYIKLILFLDLYLFENIKNIWVNWTIFSFPKWSTIIIFTKMWDSEKKRGKKTRQTWIDLNSVLFVKYLIYLMIKVSRQFLKISHCAIVMVDTGSGSKGRGLRFSKVSLQLVSLA